uniref:Uncharacterized protein n=1 Tax=Rhodnius prolixus TaxID=13249 RepID=T1I5J5_RHOPR
MRRLRPAALVVAGVIPIDLMAQERKMAYDLREVLGRSEAKVVARDHSIRTWHERWRTDTRGRWTARLIGNPSVWAGREHGEVDYYLTQFLMGHGCFTSYLYRMGKVGDLSCVFGDSDLDDAHHTFFLCDRWVPERESLEQEIGRITPENIVEIMLSQRDYWDQVATFAKIQLFGGAICDQVLELQTFKDS